MILQTSPLNSRTTASTSNNGSTAAGAPEPNGNGTPQDTTTITPDKKDRARKIVTNITYTAGGAGAGLFLGSVGGALLTHMTGNPIFSADAGLAGAIAGAASGIAAAQSDEPGALKRTFISWAGGTAGTGLGMWALGAAGPALAHNGASALFGSTGQLMGALVGGAAGAAVCFAGSEAKVSNALKHGASVAAGATAGFYLGGALQAGAHAAGMHFPLAVFAAVPVLLATTGALGGSAAFMNRKAIFDGFQGSDNGY